MLTWTGYTAATPSKQNLTNEESALNLLLSLQEQVA